MSTGPIRAEDCLIGIPRLAAESVDLVFADLPYGITRNTWDKPIDLARLWAALRHVCKPAAAMVFTAAQPFASLLVCSNMRDFRYDLIWRKNKPRGFLNAKRQPLRIHEHVLVFYRKQPLYTPQMTGGHAPVHTYTKHTSDGANYGKTRTGISGGGSTERYPVSILDIPVVNNEDENKIHPTQKPEALAEHFIQTYTKPGDLVLDPAAGSGSTLRAALRLGRRAIGFELDPIMAEKADALLAEKH